MIKIAFATLLLFVVVACTFFQQAGMGQSKAAPTAAAGSATGDDWRKAEKDTLGDWIELTFSEKFVKAGESYFSPDDKRVIFQAIEQPAGGKAADEFYAMYVADVQWDLPGSRGGKITGITNIKRLSPKGSANTCGWFHPTEPNVVIFASTIGPPTQAAAPGYQRENNRYKWMFPPEMRIVRCDLTKADGTAATLETLVGDGKAYHAEGSISNDGRHLLYCSLESGEGDIFVFDLKTKKNVRVVQAKGYDGGPFFSPDGKRICYRSDRHGDNMLQIFVADLAFNETGEIVGIKREYQLTDEPCVNWCPFWTPDGRRLIYATSILGESNYEIYMMDADPGDLADSTGTIKYGTGRKRITHFEKAGAQPGSDVLPALTHDGQWMIWSSRRGPDAEVHLWAARLLLNPDTQAKPQPEKVAKPDKKEDSDRITITDPDSGRIFIYDMSEHKLSEYHMDTHTLTPVTDPDDIERVKKLFHDQEDPN